jgi:hypothetical protein
MSPWSRLTTKHWGHKRTFCLNANIDRGYPSARRLCQAREARAGPSEAEAIQLPYLHASWMAHRRNHDPLGHDQNGMRPFAKRLDQGKFTWPTTRGAHEGAVALARPSFRCRRSG